MSQELIAANAQQNQLATPFGRGVAIGDGGNVGAIAIEQERAIAEAQGQLILAKRFPRDLNRSHTALMNSCKNAAFASVAFYAVPNRGSGPSIRFAEEVARVFGNFQYGHRELSRTEGKSEVEVFAWDMEDNNRSTRQITVLHIRDAGGSQKALKDQADIDNRIANVASKQMRGRILALMPKWLVEDAIQECRKTIAGDNKEPMEARVRKMSQAFAAFGVTQAHLETYLGHKLDTTLADEIVDLTGIYNAIKEGTAPSEFFGGEANPEPSAAAAAVAAAAAAGAATTTTTRRPRAAATPKSETKAADPEPEKAPAGGTDATDAAGGDAGAEDSNAVEENSNAAEEPEPVVTEAEQPVVQEQAPQTTKDIF